MRKFLAAAAVLLLAPSLSFGAGFALFEAGARSWAMGGAFTAVADDPSALFWNPAGIALQIDKGRQLMGGATLIWPKQDFEGMSPYPGDGYTTSQKDQVFFPPHFYFINPLNDKTSLGFSVLATFGLGTYWDDDHLGRFLSKRALLNTMDLSPNIAYKLSDSIAVGFGVDYRISTIDLTRNVGIVDPFSQRLVDVGQAHIFTEGSSNTGWGWHAGVLADLGGGFSLGALYRSEVTVDYDGTASFTQYGTGNPEFDAIVATMIPFEENTSGNTSINYPDFWSVGLAWSHEKLTISGQYAVMGWGVFQSIDLVFSEYPVFNESIPENYDDSDAYRLGFEYRASPKIALQLGLEYDSTPQPPDVMTPLLGDGDREVASVGLSYTLNRLRIDAGLQYIWLETRSTGGESPSGYDGTYLGSATLAAMSLTWMF